MRSSTHVWLGLVLMAGGCARWSTAPPSDHSALALPNLAADTVVLEVDFIRVPQAQAGFADRFWPVVDEQNLRPDTRRRLTDNGIRVGIVGQLLPAPLQEVLDRIPQQTDLAGGPAPRMGDQALARSQRLHSRLGTPGKVLVRSDSIDKFAALTRDEDGHVTGRSLEQARLLFRTTTRPLGTGAVELELTPVVEYGQPRPRYTVEQGVWSLDSTNRSQEVYEDLKVSLVLTPGQSVVLTTTAPPRGLGGQFFGADPTANLPALVLLVRLQQTQLDDRFGKPEEADPLVSSLD